MSIDALQMKFGMFKISFASNVSTINYREETNVLTDVIKTSILI